MGCGGEIKELSVSIKMALCDIDYCLSGHFVPQECGWDPETKDWGWVGVGELMVTIYQCGLCK